MSSSRGLSEDPKSTIGRIFLIGYRGTGKTTVARILAGRLGWDWVDADAALEERHGRTIRRIFDEEGEIGFRQKESEFLEELCRLERRVIATGGGVVLREENRKRLRSSGRVVWLTADAETIWRRLQTDATTGERRPRLTVGGLAEVDQLLTVREPLYRACADLTVATAGHVPSEIANTILLQFESEKLADGPASVVTRPS
jgi:shikimate kinase